jgi:hypothetical protein
MKARLRLRSIFGEETGHEALTLADPLDLDRDGIHRLLEVRQAIAKNAGHGGDRAASPPLAPSPSTRDKRPHEKGAGERQREVDAGVLDLSG